MGAVNRGGAKSLLRIFEDQVEERLAVDTTELRVAALEAAKDSVFVRFAERRERAAFGRLAILVERREPFTIKLGWAVFVLRALLLGSLDERRGEIEARPTAGKA